jgi:hypothetical protein
VNNAEASFVRHARQWTSPLNRLLRLRKLSDGVVAQIMKAETCQRWSARLELCQWIRETLDKESIWDEARSTDLSRW